MILLRCCLYGLSLLVLPNIIQGLPTSLFGSKTREYRVELQQLSPAEYLVDLPTFSSLFSTHLLFDHIDGTLSILSKIISLHFQELVQVTTQPFNINDDAFFVDVNLLKGQLQGAVGSFIEDSLPAIWSTRAAVIDKTNLSYYVEQVILQYCQPENHVLNTCIEENSEQIISTIDHYIQNHLLSIIHVIIKEDLPPLFKTTQNHVNGILTHFSHYLLSKNKQRSTINSISTASSLQQSTANTVLMNHSFENSEELILHLESAVNLYHQSLEDSSSLKKYTSLSRLD